MKKIYLKIILYKSSQLDNKEKRDEKSGENNSQQNIKK